MLFILVDVFLRLLFKSGFLFSYDLCTVVLMIITYYALVPTQAVHKHLHITLIVRLLPKKVSYIIWGVLELLSAAICGYMLVETFIKISNDAVRGVILNNWGKPLAPFEYVSIVAFGVFCLTLLFGAIESFMALRDDEYDNVMKKILAN